MSRLNLVRHLEVAVGDREISSHDFMRFLASLEMTSQNSI